MGWGWRAGGSRPLPRAQTDRPPRSRADRLEHLVALLRHVLGRYDRLQIQPEERLGVRGPHVEVPVLVVDRDAVEPRHLAVRVALGELAHLALLVGHLGVDLAGYEVPLPQLSQQLAHSPLLERQQLQDQESGDGTRVRAIEVAEVVVARDLAA